MRGLLLMRIKLDIKQTIFAYEILYKSSVNFSMRKQLQAEHGKSALENRIKDLENRKSELLNKIVDLELQKKRII